MAITMVKWATKRNRRRDKMDNLFQHADKRKSVQLYCHKVLEEIATTRKEVMIKANASKATNATKNNEGGKYQKYYCWWSDKWSSHCHFPLHHVNSNQYDTKACNYDKSDCLQYNEIVLGVDFTKVSDTIYDSVTHISLQHLLVAMMATIVMNVIKTRI